MFKNEVIMQIMADYGMNKSEATKFYNQIDDDMKKEFYAESRQSARKSFYED